ncbi:hypothetical protein KO527_12365 [Pseudoalteromonas sp. C2R02]|uniref:hypothetical protein n=1 Tax=Pseudoalteromonas sp. C2R02 TaxID=2841565 RepID=UPI001C081C7B|nr:hypothetical protein [Pseudoalteromonas sp. C2R02]MBU2970144.1 hypothetical protein [Pseudoalteromonas sp. C2R02]
MFKHFIKASAFSATLLTSFVSQAGVFTCDAIVQSVEFYGNGSSIFVELKHKGGWYLDGATISADKSALVVDALAAKHDGGVHTFVLHHEDTGDKKCNDNDEGAGKLLAIIKK